MYPKLLILLTIFSFQSALSQDNLLLNGDFEEFNFCPSDFLRRGERYPGKEWTSPNPATPDYFHKCSRNAGVPVNFAGIRNAFSGKGYGGIILYVRNRDYKEYLQGELSRPLQKGTKYIVTMHVCWSTQSSFMLTQIGVKFSGSPVKMNGSGSLYDGDIAFGIKNSREWEAMADTFTARGDEKFLLIGNFQKQELMEWKEVRTDGFVSETTPVTNAAYYYIDKVEVMEVMERKTVSQFPVGEYFIGEGIYFDTDKYTLNDSSHAYLEMLIRFLKEHPERKIKIEGHTDRFGTDDHNILLSEKRAKEVMNYLIAAGITENRITIKGWGSDKPVTGSEELQHLNRRIEIFIE